MERSIHNIYVGPDFLAQGELVEGVLFLHCDVIDSSFKTFRKIRDMIKLFKQVAKDQYGYDEPMFSYTQNGRWCKLMGAEYVSSFDEDNKHFEVWVWEQKSQ